MLRQPSCCGCGRSCGCSGSCGGGWRSGRDWLLGWHSWVGAVAAALLVGGAPGEVTEEAGPAGGYAPEALYQEQRDLVVLVAQCVVVVALVEGHVALACGVIEARARGEAALAAPEDGAAERLLRGADS